MSENLKTDTLAWEYEKVFFEELRDKVKYNVYQAEFYRRMAEEYHDNSFLDKADRTEACSKIWDLDYYLKHSLKQVVGINRCGDSFCYICQSIKAQRRYEIYSPVLKSYEEENDVYHVVFSVPNVDGGRLKWTLDKMTDRFARLIRYFNGGKKIKGVSFESFGYRGAVRSLEITTGKRKRLEDNDFHPHFHCMFILRKGMNFEKNIYNSFSADRYGHRAAKLFSVFDWLLQRIWCLLMLDIEVTKENIINIYEATGFKYKDGFSVNADLVTDGNYHEIFKYAIKGTYKKEAIFTYNDFEYLYDALKNRRVYQTYGCLQKHNFNEVDDIFSPKMQTDYLFDIFLQALQRSEKPIRIQSELEEILKDFKTNGRKRKRPIKYIGPSTLRRAFKNKSEEEIQNELQQMIAELEEGD